MGSNPAWRIDDKAPQPIQWLEGLLPSLLFHVVVRCNTDPRAGGADRGAHIRQRNLAGFGASSGTDQ